MARAFRKITKRIFILSNFIIVIVFLLACANSFLHPKGWWFVAVLGLIFPLLLLLVFAFLIFWVLFRSRWALLSLAALLIGFTNIRALIGIHFSKEFKQEKPEGSIRVLTWNVTWFDEQKKQRKNNYRNDMLQFIQQQQADILCFQEYLEPNLPKQYYSNVNDIEKLGYPYHYFISDYDWGNGAFQVGVIIFSRYPIKDTSHITYPGSKLFRAAESLLAADIDINGKMIRVFNTHLQSVVFRQNDYRHLEIIKNADDSIVEASKSVLKKLKQGYNFRGDQVNIVRKQLDSSPYPEILCGDFNDVPNSYTYFHIKADRKDAFVDKGLGLGRTFSHLSPTLRIDYIMADEKFEVLQYKRFLLPYSDHYPVVADLKLTGGSE